MEQKSILEDEWLLIAMGACVLCTLLSLLNHGFPERLFTSRPPPALATQQLQQQQLQQPAVSTGALAAKAPGHWIVDQHAAPDSDTMLLADAVANAKPGDQILIRPGTYAEHLVISQSLTLIGDAQSPPTILGTGPSTLSIQGAEVTLQNVSIAHKPNPGDQLQPAIFVKNGLLIAKKLEVQELDPSGAANDACLVLSHSKLILDDSAMSGCSMGIVATLESNFQVASSKFSNVLKIGVSASGKSDGTIDHTSFTRTHSAIAVQGGSVKATNVQITDGSRGLEAGPDSTAVLEDSDISDQTSAAVLIDSAVVRIERARFSRNGYGIAVSHRALLTVSGTKILDSLKEPYHWTKSDTVTFTGGGNDPEPAN